MYEIVIILTSIFTHCMIPQTYYIGIRQSFLIIKLQRGEIMANIVKIPKQKIFTVFDEVLSKEDQKRLNKLENNFLPFDKVIPVEKDPHQDKYYVVGRYPTFFIHYKNTNYVYCLIEEYTGKKGQLIKIAQRFLYQHPSTQTKQKMVDHLLMEGLTRKEIVKLTYFQNNQLNNFIYDNKVPYIVERHNELAGRPGSIASINQVTRLKEKYKLSRILTDELYYKVKSKSLTQDQLKALSKMLGNTVRFNSLSLKQQNQMVSYVISNQALLINQWQNKINEFLLKYGGVF